MEQISIFSGTIPFKVDKPIRLIELFAGIGAQAKALERMGVEFEHYKISEWEVNATASYKAIHKKNDNTDYSAEFTNEELAEILFNIGISTDGKKAAPLKYIKSKSEYWKRTVFNDFKATNNVGSILNIEGNDLAIVNTDTYCYICCYSFPCQDLSLAGKQKLMAKGSGTRSSLLWEVERLLDECTELPQVLLMENVTQVHGKKNADSFRQWCDKLESLGYKNYWEDLNAKDFGVPQNRDRTFMVSVLGDYSYEFPVRFELQIRLKDVLEETVDSKYYLETPFNQYADGTCRTIKHQYYKNSYANFIRTGDMGATGVEIKKLIVREATKQGYAEAVEGDSINLEQPNSKTRRGRVGHGVAQTLTTSPQQAVVEPVIVEDFYKNRDERIYEEYSHSLRADRNGLKVVEPVAYDEQNGYIRKDGCVGTLTTDGSSPKHNNRVIEADLRIRKLTPKECWRLMGFTDADFEKAEAVNSNTQLYKQAGNSIVVDVLMAIFSKLF